MVQMPRWQSITVFVVLLIGALFALPNLTARDGASNLPGFLPQNPVNLGLDLRGGAYFLIDVDTSNVAQEYLEGLEDSARLELRSSRITYDRPTIEGQTLTFRVRDAANRDEAARLLGNLANDITVVRVGDDTINIVLSDANLADRINETVIRARAVIERRINETGLVEPVIQRQQATRILIQLPGEKNSQRLRDILLKTGKLSFHFLEEDAAPGVAPIGSTLLPDVDNPEITYAVKDRAIITGDMLVDAQPTFDDNNSPAVSFRFNSIGSTRFGRATAENVGKLFAIVLDDKVISAPQIRSPITGGQGIITGNYTTAEANDFSILLRAGSLPAPLIFLEERSVGPGLGADSIKAGAIACILGLVLVLIFMFIMYGGFGLYANIALASNLVLILGALSALQATLTLPGIAGIVLTIGMAVDANVLVFERIREEFQKIPRTVRAIETGYRSAMGTIFDANLTTLIAAAILFLFGSGPVKGFAVTLGIGILTSMFTALMVTRLLISWWVKRNDHNTLPIAKDPNSKPSQAA